MSVTKEPYESTDTEENNNLKPIIKTQGIESLFVLGYFLLENEIGDLDDLNRIERQVHSIIMAKKSKTTQKTLNKWLQ